MNPHANPLHVSLVAIPDSMAAPLHGIYETLYAFEAIARADSPDGQPAFQVEIVGPTRGILNCATQLPVTVHRSFDEVERTAVVIVPSMHPTENNEWLTGRHPAAVQWLRAMHDQGAILCSACTGVMLLAETGLLNGLKATIHWAFAASFRRNFPAVELNLREVLVTGGERQEFVMTGANSSWQDLTLYLVTRHLGADAARSIGRYMLFQWHADSQAPYVTFAPPMDHGDAAMRELQLWLHDHVAIARPVEEMVSRSGLSDRTFKRRFRSATGYAPLQYVQCLRVEEAKRLLERTDTPVDRISWNIGYEDGAFFRRLFKRLTRLTPSEYRRKFRIPSYALPA